MSGCSIHPGGAMGCKACTQAGRARQIRAQADEARLKAIEARLDVIEAELRIGMYRKRRPTPDGGGGRA